jgi:hypothetical protein
LSICIYIYLFEYLHRFAAVEISPDEFKSSAVTYVLSGGILAALLGPTSANYTSNVIGKQYVGSFLTMALIGFLNFVVLASIKFPAKDEALAVESPFIKRRPLLTIIKQPLFIISCMIPTIAHTVMIMIMGTCSLSMKKGDYSFNITTVVLETHFLAMFLPGFFTGWLISKWGAFNVSLGGGVVFALAGVAFLLGKELWNYFLGMMLIGLAWNFAFSAGTVMLTGCYEVCHLLI